jgi:predicted phosphoribosyltransferase
MRFKNRREAGRQICQLLKKYQGQDAIVFALPRGGVVVADEIANFLHAPLDLILAHKIGHPHHSEYAIAAMSEDGQLIGNMNELSPLGKNWLEKEKEAQFAEFKRKRKLYLKNRPQISLHNKIAFLVDDGIATGLTMQAGIMELKRRHPKKIVAVVPVSPKDTADLLKLLVDDFVCPMITSDFKGSVGAYFEDFPQVEDEEVIQILGNENYEKEW